MNATTPAALPGRPAPMATACAPVRHAPRESHQPLRASPRLSAASTARVPAQKRMGT